MLIKTIGANAAASLLVLATVCVVVLSLPAEIKAEDLTMQLDQQAAAIREKPALFDFDNYQKSFNKKYGSPLERAVRKCYYLAKAIKAYLSGVAYKFWRSSSYLAINEFSDRSKQELDMMLNKEMAKGRKSSATKTVIESDDNSKIIEVNFEPEQVAHELENEIERTLEKVGYDGLLGQARSKRQKRELPESSGGASIKHKLKARPKHRRPRHMSMDKLVQGSGPVAQPPEVQAKIVNNPKGKNEHYDPLLFEGVTKGLIDQQVEVTGWVFTDQLKKPSEPEEADEKPPVEASAWISAFRKTTDALLPYVKGVYDVIVDDIMYGDVSDGDDEDDDEDEEFLDVQQEFLPDEMFVDLRQSGCMLLPKRQYNCGSCYAFAGITMAEFYYCKATNQLVEFSEQYLVDCGKGHIDYLKGCSGGIAIAIPKFVHNFGLELAQTYPYEAREKQCPYHEGIDINKTGFIRMKHADYVEVPIERWPEILHYSPLFVGVATHEDFLDYGGGVYDGLGCPEDPDHAMVVVGHGREDGEEFWLLRNSHGVHWGEGGYFKIAKSAPKRCFEESTGFVFGTKNGVNYTLEPKFNDDNEAVINWKLRMALLEEQKRKRKIEEILDLAKRQRTDARRFLSEQRASNL